MTSEIQQQQQQLDTPVAPEAATGVTIHRTRHLVGRSGTRCQELQHPNLLLLVTYFLSELNFFHFVLCRILAKILLSSLAIYFL
jgi:hypothetical protein